jgi:predicted RNase H-like HicB family nuclease
MKTVNLSDYIKEVLKVVKYKEDKQLHCVVASVAFLPGCMTQADSVEEARDNIIDAIELWITVGLREGEKIPSINGINLASALNRRVRKVFPKKNHLYA